MEELGLTCQTAHLMLAHYSWANLKAWDPGQTLIVGCSNIAS